MSTQTDNPDATAKIEDAQRPKSAEPPGKAGALGNEAPPKKDEESAELDDALDDSFPASDPPSQTAKGSSK